jgi:hypothetical protein
MWQAHADRPTHPVSHLPITACAAKSVDRCFYRKKSDNVAGKYGGRVVAGKYGGRAVAEENDGRAVVGDPG